MEKYTIDNPNVIVFDIGPAPLDKTVIIEYQKDDVFISVYSDPDGDLYIASKKSIIENGLSNDDNYETDDYLIECYEGIQNTSKSEYYEDFTILSAMIIEKRVEIREYVLDTKNYGIRIGARCDSDGIIIIAEAFNQVQPEYKEYIQIQKKNDKYIYTASHESYFMKYQLGDIYHIYFGNPPKEEYYINITDLSDLDSKYYYFAEFFKHLQNIIAENEFQNETSDIIEKYNPIITSIKGTNKDGYQIIEMVLDKSKASRLYLSIQLVDSQSIVYRVSKNSILESILSNKSIDNTIEEYDDIEKTGKLEKQYFYKLKKYFDYMINNRHNFTWRYGDRNKYNI
ncbi:hypothetical protein SAMN04487934_11816 [Eubacterium ruminantium]|nr:hypothetical protein SAMN04487934_11816 [Eubacterium ruminantium]